MNKELVMNRGCTYKQIVQTGNSVKNDLKIGKKIGQGEGILKIRDLRQGEGLPQNKGLRTR